jgi:succinate dehydrogenase/fumarate reductase flavoprotein subunit
MKSIYKFYWFFPALIFLSFSAYSTIKNNFDVVVVGTTPAGIAAAVNAAKSGLRVAITSETKHIGGLTTSGLTNSDFRTFESLGGTWQEFMNRVVRYY